MYVGMLLVLGISCAIHITVPFCLFCWYLLFELRHHLYTIKCMDLGSIAQWVLKIVCTHAISTYHSQHKRHFILPKRFPCVSLWSILSFQPGKQPWPAFYHYGLGFFCFFFGSRTSCKWIYIVCMLQFLAFFTQSHVFEIPPCHCVCQGFLSLHFWVVFHCKNMPQLVYP